MLTGLSVWEELLGVTRTLFLRSIRTADAVHPRAGKFQTNLATVPEYMKSSLLRTKGTLSAHWFLHPHQVMNAVVNKDANKAVNHAWPTDNSGLPLSWWGGLPANRGRVHCGNNEIYQACEYQTLRFSLTGTWMATRQYVRLCYTGWKGQNIFVWRLGSFMSCW